jgi:hypothetical protein
MTQLGQSEIRARIGGILNGWPAVGLAFGVVGDGAPVTRSQPRCARDREAQRRACLPGTRQRAVCRVSTRVSPTACRASGS